MHAEPASAILSKSIAREVKSTMRLRVRFFSALRRVTGQSELDYNFSGRTAGQLWDDLSQRFPELTPFTESRAIAVNLKHTTPGHVLKEGDEVAFFPPVSGG